MELWSEGCQTCPPPEADLILFDGQAEIGVRFTNRKVLEALAPQRSPAWRKLDLAYLHRYLIDELTVARHRLSPKIDSIKSKGHARKLAHDGGIACLTQPIPMSALRAVSEAGDLMPQKSTYFYPKLATGLVVNPLTRKT